MQYYVMVVNKVSTKETGRRIHFEWNAVSCSECVSLVAINKTNSNNPSTEQATRRVPA